jgi:hypothetical protein
MVTYFGEYFLTRLSTIFRHDSVDRVSDFLERKGFSLEKGKKNRGNSISATHPNYPNVEIGFMAKATVSWRDFYYDQIGLWFYEKDAEDATEYYFLGSSFIGIIKIKRFLKGKQRITKVNNPRLQSGAFNNNN